ncbi:MAG: YqaJ viral recombinase family protein [Ruminococcus sp.]|nr:YqaJ viral recombinase family protein [Ruminococcus sp.]
MFIDAENREKWLEIRKSGIGGSDAGTAVGKNSYKSNVALWREKVGIDVPEDISDKPAVARGKQAEPCLRELFRLDFPEYHVEYHEFGMYFSDEFPYMFATLDGELTEISTGRRGVLEIKTTTIRNSSQWDEWDNRIPDSYYIQVLHQLICTGFDFVVVMANIKYYNDDIPRVQIRYYFIERSEVQADIEWLKREEQKFWQSVQERKCPSLILPEI